MHFFWGCKPYHYDMGEANNPFSLDNRSILYIYKVLKHLPMQWMAIWMHPYGHQTHQGRLSWLNQGNNWVQILPICVKGEARNPFRLNYSSILYILKLFKHLLMQWMSIWKKPYGHQPWRWVELVESG